MTVIRPNSISGVTSITAQVSDINIFGASSGFANITAGNISAAGTITYEDVTNIDSVGVVTARTGIKIGPSAGVAGTFFADGSYVTAGIITATTFHGSGANLTGITGTTINSNADNRIITGSGTANTLNGESTLTHSAGVLSVNEPSLSTDGKIIVKGNDTNNHDIITAYSNSSTRGSFAIRNGTGIAPSFLVGTRGGSETLGLMSNGTERFRIGASGQFGIGGATYGTAGQVLTSGGASAAPTWGGAGKVLQVQYKRGGVTSSSNSGGWTDSVESGLNVDITPTSSTSFIIVQMHSVGGNTSSGRSFFLRLRRKINNTGDTNVASFQIGDGSNGGMQSLALTHVEVPNNWNTSHVINYRIRFGQDGSGTARFDYATTSVLYAMEVQP